MCGALSLSVVDESVAETGFDLLVTLTSSLLYATDELLIVAFGDVEVVVCHVSPGLLDLTLELIPTTFPLELAALLHGFSFPRVVAMTV